MERRNGYIDLTSEILKAKKRKKKDFVATTRCSTDAYWIKNLNGKNYLFKVIVETNQLYRSLIIEEMAKIANIAVPHTELAILGYFKGELIEDYRKDDYRYIPGAIILYEYFLAMKDTEYIKSIVPSYLLKEKLTEEEIDIVLEKLNNLETIWNALDFHYRKYEKKNEIVFDIMKKLANRFAFDFITMQRDRHASNWETEENDTDAVLTPLYDSNRSFYYPSFDLKFHISDQYRKTDLYNELEYFLTYSDSDFVNYFYKLYELFTPSKISILIEQIEKKIESKIPRETYLEIIGSYQEHYEKLTEIVERRGKKR